MLNIEVETRLLGKAELFKVIALGHAIKKPILFIGQPGVAKTQVMREYAEAVQKYYHKTLPTFKYNHFIIEANDDSRPSEITGRIDLEKLVIDRKYVLHSDIEQANAIMINEVDKGTSAFRNAMLSVMNERVLFRGNEEVNLPWELFVGTCNSIPEDEIKSHFFDRFIIKYTVPRLTSNQINTLFKKYEKGSDTIIETIHLNIPSRSDLDTIVIDENRLSKFISVAYESLSDRSLTQVYDVIRSIMFIWNVNIDKALMKAAELLINKAASNKLSNLLYSAEMKEIMTDVELLEMNKSTAAADDFKKQITMIVNKLSIYSASGALDNSQVETLLDVLMNILPEGYNLESYSKSDPKIGLNITENPPMPGTDALSSFYDSSNTLNSSIDPFA
jgi:hypothetical protein